MSEEEQDYPPPPPDWKLPLKYLQLRDAEYDSVFSSCAEGDDYDDTGPVAIIMREPDVAAYHRKLYRNGREISRKQLMGFATRWKRLKIREMLKKQSREAFNRRHPLRPPEYVGNPGAIMAELRHALAADSLPRRKMKENLRAGNDMARFLDRSGLKFKRPTTTHVRERNEIAVILPPEDYIEPILFPFKHPFMLLLGPIMHPIATVRNILGFARAGALRSMLFFRNLVDYSDRYTNGMVTRTWHLILRLMFWSLRESKILIKEAYDEFIYQPISFRVKQTTNFVSIFFDVLFSPITIPINYFCDWLLGIPGYREWYYKQARFVHTHKITWKDYYRVEKIKKLQSQQQSPAPRQDSMLDQVCVFDPKRVKAILEDEDAGIADHAKESFEELKERRRREMRLAALRPLPEELRLPTPIRADNMSSSRRDNKMHELR